MYRKTEQQKNWNTKMLIACKCLNITLKSTVNNLTAPVTTASSISNYDDIAYKTKSSLNANQVHTISSSTMHPRNDQLDDNHDDQPPYIQCSTAELLDINQLQFFRTVNYFWLKITYINVYIKYRGEWPSTHTHRIIIQKKDKNRLFSEKRTVDCVNV